MSSKKMPYMVGLTAAPALRVLMSSGCVSAKAPNTDDAASMHERIYLFLICPVKIFYPRFFAWVNLFLLNHILLYSLLFPFQSIQTYVARVPVLNGLFRLHILILSCVLYKSQPSSKKDSPRTSD